MNDKPLIARRVRKEIRFTAENYDDVLREAERTGLTFSRLIQNAWRIAKDEVRRLPPRERVFGEHKDARAMKGEEGEIVITSAPAPAEYIHPLRRKPVPPKPPSLVILPPPSRDPDLDPKLNKPIAG